MSFNLYKNSCFLLAMCVIILGFTLCNGKSREHKKDFVYMEGKTFKLNGEDYFPMILNYGVELMMDNSGMWVRANTGYGDNDIQRTKGSGLSKFKADMQMIKDLGFNSVRLCGIGEYICKDSTITKYADIGKDTVIILKGEVRKKYFQALDDMFKVLDEIGLKAIILTKKIPDINKAADEYLASLLQRFKNEPAILAWDFFNEPLYFDQPDRKKEEVYAIVKGWKKFARANDPDHLVTIGLTGAREMFEWDPNILDLDFLCIHPYEFHKGEVENDIYWFGKYVKKPWVIGETGYSADNDSVSYDTQKKYGERFLKQAINCGASGFSWWQYKDVQWYEYQSNFLGLLEQKGTTQTSKKDLVVNGTPKPVAAIFKNFDPFKKTGECNCLDNYYNYDGLNQYAIKGKLVNKANGQPIEGGGVVAWDQYYGKSNLTYTRKDGSFIIYGNYKLYHYIVSGTLMNYVRDDLDWDKLQLTNVDGVPTYDVGTIKLTPFNLYK